MKQRRTLLLLAACVGLAGGCGVVAPSAPVSAPPSATSAPEVTRLVWHRVGLEDLGAEEFMATNELITSPDGFLMTAVRYQPTEQQAILESEDGLDWLPVGGAPFPGGWVYAIGAGDAGQIAGIDEPPYAVARRDGDVWRTLGPVGGTVDPDDDDLSVLTHTPYGWFANAMHAGQTHRAVTSQDGVMWADVAVEAEGRLVGIDARGRDVLLGFADPAVVAWSRDGVSFPATSIAHESGETAVNDVVLGPGGALAGGRVGADGVVWHSVDGVSWTRHQPEPKAVEVFNVAVVRNTYFAFGWIRVGGDRGSVGGLWASIDGATWSRVRDWAGDPGGPVRMTAGHDRLVLAGEENDSRGDRIVVWVGVVEG